MAIQFETPLSSAVGMLADSVHGEIERKIKAALMIHAEKVVDEVAKQMARNLNANLVKYDDWLDGPKITLMIDRVKTDFRS